MADPSLAIQNAIEAALRGDSALAAAMDGTVRIYTVAAPNGAPLPHVTIGDDQVIDDSTCCTDSSEVYSTMHVWARVEDDVAASRVQAKNMTAAIRSLFRQPVQIAGFTNTVQHLEDYRHFIDADGLTAHAVVTLRFLVDPE